MDKIATIRAGDLSDVARRSVADELCVTLADNDELLVILRPVEDQPVGERRAEARRKLLDLLRRAGNSDQAASDVDAQSAIDEAMSLIRPRG